MSRLITIVLLLAYHSLAARQAEGLVARFCFSGGDLRNEVAPQYARAVGVTLTEDRFGNPASAYYFHGTAGSYINLGSNESLKQPHTTISLWFRMDNIVYHGKGYEANPIFLTHCYEGDDFNEAYGISYEFNSRRIAVASNNVIPGDSMQVVLRSNMTVTPAEWYHVAIVSNDTVFGLYVNGVLQNKVSKAFVTRFLKDDSLILGYSANDKNVRFFNGTIDDVEIYNRVLSSPAIMELYRQGNPEGQSNLISGLIIVLLGIFIVALVMTWLLKREKIKNRRQRQMYEMEMQVMRAQMNPHFLFNAMNSVQQFILENDNENAYKYLVKFSRLLRMILESNNEENISLEHEIDILTGYIELEALRFEKSFSYEIVTAASINTSGIRIPQMLIQPLVENAIWHGLLPKDKDRCLSVRFEQTEPGSLCCTIDDNGVGRGRKKPEGIVHKRRSMAISFIHQRLKLMNREWNRNYDLEIIDKVDEQARSTGTRVIIRLPVLN